MTCIRFLSQRLNQVFEFTFDIKHACSAIQSQDHCPPNPWQASVAYLQNRTSTTLLQSSCSIGSPSETRFCSYNVVLLYIAHGRMPYHIDLIHAPSFAYIRVLKNGVKDEPERQDRVHNNAVLARTDSFLRTVGSTLDDRFQTYSIQYQQAFNQNSIRDRPRINDLTRYRSRIKNLTCLGFKDFT